MPGGLNSLLSGPHAAALEDCLSRVRAAAPRSAVERAASGEVLARVHPWVVAAARTEHSARGRAFGLEVEEFVQVGLCAVAEHARRFQPGQAGPGRTLFPKYALKLARQAMGRLLQERRAPVALTSWGLKLRRRAQKRAEREGVPLREALLAEGASPASVLALERGAVQVVRLDDDGDVGGSSHTFARSSRSAREGFLSLAAAQLESAAEAEDDAVQAQLGEEALLALDGLPAEVRAAVAGPLGLAGPATPLPALARRLGVSLAKAEELRASGLAALKAALEDSR